MLARMVASGCGRRLSTAWRKRACSFEMLSPRTQNAVRAEPASLPAATLGSSRKPLTTTACSHETLRFTRTFWKRLVTSQGALAKGGDPATMPQPAGRTTLPVKNGTGSRPPGLPQRSPRLITRKTSKPFSVKSLTGNRSASGSAATNLTGPMNPVRACERERISKMCKCRLTCRTTRSYGAICWTMPWKWNGSIVRLDAQSIICNKSGSWIIR